MARKKETPKPLFSVKHDFYASLDEFVQQVILLDQALKTVLDLDQLTGEPQRILRERLDAVERAILGGRNDDA